LTLPACYETAVIVVLVVTSCQWTTAFLSPETAM
jgi:hypothetical protein